MIQWRVVPILKWPMEHTKRRTRSRFGANWSTTTELLERELRFLRGQNIVLQMAVGEQEIRNDGWIRASARPTHPGVLLTFDSKFGPLTYPCDNFTDWKANVRAIALALEALRKVDRYGVTKRGEQYTGWKALPSKVDGGPHAVLAQWSGFSEREVRNDPKAAYRAAAKEAHPDRGGSGEAFSEVGDAARLLGVAQ